MFFFNAEILANVIVIPRIGKKKVVKVFGQYNYIS